MKSFQNISLLVFFLSSFGFAQLSPDYKGGFSFKFDEEGKKEMKIAAWGQFQALYIDNVPEDVNHFNLNIRRARLSTYFKINNKFMMVFQMGLNNLNASKLSPFGEGEPDQIRIHDFWGQYNLNEKHSVGAGLHFYNGISRFNSFSANTSLTMDNNRQQWATLGLSDQIGRHLGVFAKGEIGRLLYRVSVNDAITDGLDMREASVNGPVVYGGKRILGSRDAGYAYSGYFEYNFKDIESIFLPYKAGTYLGSKDVFNVGAGFFIHPNGSVFADENGVFVGEDVQIFAVDAFYEKPLGTEGAALTAYAVYQNQNYGKDYLFNVYATGDLIYSHWGYLFKGAEDKPRFQPYFFVAHDNIDATKEDLRKLGIGINALMSGRNLKFTLEYRHEEWIKSENFVTLQAQIYL